MKFKSKDYLALFSKRRRNTPSPIQDQSNYNGPLVTTTISLDGRSRQMFESFHGESFSARVRNAARFIERVVKDE